MTKSTETEIAILQTQMTEVKASLEVIKADQKTNFDAVLSEIKGLSNTPTEIVAIYTRIAALEKSKARNWVWNTLSAFVGAVLVSLVIYALTVRR